MGIPAYGAIKRNRGPGHAVLNAAQHGGDPARSAYVKELKKFTPNPGKRIAQGSLFMPKGRSGIRHVLKTDGMKDKFASRNRMHHHDVMRKYYRGKNSNGIKSHLQTYYK